MRGGARGPTGGPWRDGSGAALPQPATAGPAHPSALPGLRAGPPAVPLPAALALRRKRGSSLPRKAPPPPPPPRRIEAGGCDRATRGWVLGSAVRGAEEQ